MGVTISSKNYSCDMGYGGFRNFRILVAEKVSSEIGEHYKSLENAPFFDGRDEFFNKHDKKTNDLVEKGKLSPEVGNFLYMSDCEGKISVEQAKMVYELIKNENDNLAFGYIGRHDCAKMSDLKNIFSDNTIVKWY